MPTPIREDYDSIIREMQRRLDRLERRPDAVPVGPGTGDLHYTHSQSSSSTTWTITHNLGKFPSVLVMTSAGDELEGDVFYASTNVVVLTFSAAFSGTAYLN